MTTVEHESIATTAIADFKPVEAALADLQRRTKGVLFEVSTVKGMDAARKARAELREYRISLEDKRVELKAPVLERGRLLDAEAKRITAALVALEEPIDAQIKAEEKRKADERAARDRAEAERIAGINRQLDAIRQMPLGALGKTVGGIQGELVAAQEIDVAAFPPEYREAAQALVDDAVDKLTAMRDQRRDQDREAKRLADERVELARLRKADEDRMAAEQRVAEAARAEAQRVEDEARAARQREEDTARAEADRAAQIERDRLAAEHREENERVAEANRVERERLAQVEREQQAERDAALRVMRERLLNEGTLVQAAEGAVALLIKLGEAEHIVTLALQAALAREGVAA